MKKPLSAIALATLLAGMPLAHAQIQYQPIAPAAAPAPALSPSAQFSADSKAASARLSSDQQLCNGEADSASRMQCKRDAKAEYDKAVADAKARMAAATTQPRTTAQAQPVKAAACADCGTVVSVTQADKPGEGSAVGLIAGGVAGALLGNQVGGGTGKKLATLAGAAGGAFAGREVEKRVSTQQTWTVGVQYPGNQSVSYEFAQDPGFRAGDLVRRSATSIVRP